MSKNRCFRDLIGGRLGAGCHLVAGLDIPFKLEKFPAVLRELEHEEMIVKFACDIVDATCDLSIAAYKPNVKFWVGAYGVAGYNALKTVTAHINKVAPTIPLIGDDKLGDIGKTNDAYEQMLNAMSFDAMTVPPYMGRESLDISSLLGDPNMGIFVLCKTSNLGAGEFQDLLVRDDDPESQIPEMPLYQRVALNCATDWAEKSQALIGLVAGATYPEHIGEIRKQTGPKLVVLSPGIGAQEGDLEKTVKYGGHNLIINVSSKIMQASSGPDYAEAARAAAEKYIQGIDKAYAAIA